MTSCTSSGPPTLTAIALGLRCRWAMLTAHRERGLTTTEVAVLTFILVAIAITIGGVIYNYAQSTVEGNPAPTDLTPTIPD